MDNLIYLRKSRAEEGLSTDEVLSRHRAALLELAEKLGLQVDGTYEEVASGEKLYARPQMLRLLERVRGGGVASVLCMDIDRLGRGGMADQGVIFDAFRENGTLIVTPEKTYDLNRDLDIEMTEFKAFFARAEWRAIRKRMRRGLMQTIESGGYTPNAPYGYRQCRRGKLPSLEIVEEEAEFVRFIYRQYLAGDGAQSIARQLNAMGSSPHRGAQWSRSSVRHILSNPTFAGKVAWNRVKHFRPGEHGHDRHHVVYMPESEWLLVDGAHEPIIPFEQWEAAQQRRRARSVPPRRSGAAANPLAGLIVCARCGRKMQKSGEYLLCPTAGCCAAARFTCIAEALYSALEPSVPRLRLRPRAVDALPSPLSAVGALERELARVEARLPRLYEFLEDGTYDRPTFLSRLESAQGELSALRERLDEARGRLPESTPSSPDVPPPGDLRELGERLSPAEQNALLKALVERVEYDKPKKTLPCEFHLTVVLRQLQ